MRIYSASSQSWKLIVSPTQIFGPRGTSDLDSPEALLRITPIARAISPGLDFLPPIALVVCEDFILEEGRSRPAVFYTLRKISLWKNILELTSSQPNPCRN